VLRYICARIVWSVIIIAGIVTVNFVLTHILPGDVTTALVGEFPAPQAYIDQLRDQLGLNHPLYVQLWRYWLAVPRAGGAVDSSLVALSLVGYSVPVFWLGQILILIFAVQLGWLPASGITSVREQTSGWAWFAEYLRHLILPGFCVSIYYTAVVVRIARSSMLEVFDQDFVLTARAKGLTDWAVLWRHVLRNSLIPVITVIGYNFGYSLTGAILTETVFAWPGLGGLFVSSVQYKDYPVLSGIFLLVATAVVIANLVTDLLYAVADPRVRTAVT
jgi:peptide/nickel transport system permease protein